MTSLAERTWMLFNNLSTTQNEEEKLPLIGQIHDALRREPKNISAIFPKLFALRMNLNDECQMALCRLIDETVSRGSILEEDKNKEEFLDIVESSSSSLKKRTIRSYAALYPQILTDLIKNPVLDLWQRACLLKYKIFCLLKCNDEGIIMNIIRFMNRIILIQSEREPQIKIQTTLDKIYLTSFPKNHSFLSKDGLIEEANILLEECIKMIRAPNTLVGTISAIVNGLVGICLLRPKLQLKLGSSLFEASQNIPSHLNQMQRNSYTRCIRNFFISIYRVLPASPTSKLFEGVAILLGSTMQDLQKYQKSARNMTWAHKQILHKQQQPAVDQKRDFSQMKGNPVAIALEQMAGVIVRTLILCPEEQLAQRIRSLYTQSSQQQGSTSEKDIQVVENNNMEVDPPQLSQAEEPLAQPPSNIPFSEATPANLSTSEMVLSKISDLPPIESETLYLILLKNILASEQYFSNKQVQLVSRDNNCTEEYASSKRKSLRALKYAWVLIMSRVSTNPLLMNGNPGIESKDSYKYKIGEALVEFFFEEIKTRFDYMIMWLDHLWLTEKKIEKKLGRKITSCYFYWVGYIMDQFYAKTLPSDKIVAKFLVEVPELSQDTVKMLMDKYCEVPERTELGLFTLQALASLRPKVADLCVKTLLKYTNYTDNSIRTPAIFMCTRLYISNATLVPIIENHALSNIHSLSGKFPAKGSAEKEAPVQNLFKEEPKDEYVSKQVISQVELYFVLCSRKQELFSEILKLFKTLSTECQKSVLTAMEPLLNSISSRPGKLMELIKSHPDEANLIAELARHATKGK